MPTTVSDKYDGDADNRVKITAVSAFSFTFTTLDGHFDGAGATTRFTTYKNKNWVVLQQNADAPNASPINSAIAPIGAIYWSWPKQAKNLARAISDDIARQCAEKTAPGERR